MKPPLFEFLQKILRLALAQHSLLDDKGGLSELRQSQLALSGQRMFGRSKKHQIHAPASLINERARIRGIGDHGNFKFAFEDLLLHFMAGTASKGEAHLGVAPPE